MNEDWCWRPGATRSTSRCGGPAVYGVATGFCDLRQARCWPVTWSWVQFPNGGRSGCPCHITTTRFPEEVGPHHPEQHVTLGAFSWSLQHETLQHPIQGDDSDDPTASNRRSVFEVFGFRGKRRKACRQTKKNSKRNGPQPSCQTSTSQTANQNRCIAWG